MKAVTCLAVLALLGAVRAARFPARPEQKAAIDGWTEHAVRTVPHPLSGTATQVTYRSPPLVMQAGQVIFSDPNKTPLKFPEGEYGISAFQAEIVDENGDQTPLSEVYLHHWLVFDGKTNAGFCDPNGGGGYLTYIFGVGAESRKTVTKFPSPYAYMVDGTEVWGANIHVLRTVDVPDVKSCIECHCPEGGGGFQCCPDGSFCPTGPHPPGPKTYYLQYTITMIPKDEAVPIKIYVLDASSCEIEYDVPQCQDPSTQPCTNSITNTVPVKEDAEIIFVQPHQHIGASNITLALDNNNICTGAPIYGTGNTAGNEKGYVVEMTVCTPNPPIKIKKGQSLTGSGLYSSNPYHDAVMSLIFITTAAPGALDMHRAYLAKKAGLPVHNSTDIAIGASIGAVAVAIAFAAIALYRRRSRTPDNFEQVAQVPLTNENGDAADEEMPESSIA